MKIAVITRHAVPNYGSLLQAFATEKVIESLGHTCQIIDYVRRDEDPWHWELTLLGRKPNWFQNPVKRAAYLLLRLPGSIVVGKKFQSERKAWLHLTCPFATAEEMQSIEADVYMTGSDQVWGPVADGTYDPAYCLCFAAGEKKRIAYGASFGRDCLTPEAQAHFQKWLGRYVHIAVREKSAVDMVKGLGFSAVQVLDPVLLLGAKPWTTLCAPLKRGKYILVYQLHRNESLNRYAKKAAKDMGLPLVRLSVSLHQMVRGGRFVWNPSVKDFLGYLQNAQLLITDSFHATAFAILFHRPFVEVLPNNGTDTRNRSLLEMTGLTGRILKDPENMDLAKKSVDFTYADKILAEKRAESMEILRAMLETE